MDNHNRDQERSLDNVMELIDFRLIKPGEGGRNKELIFGINVYKVKEVIFKPDQIYKVPTSIEYLEGMIKLRENVIPVINLQLSLGYYGDNINSDYLVITEFNNIACAFMVHQIKQIRRVSWEEIISPPDEIRDQYGDLLTAITILSTNEIMLILDFEKIIADSNFNLTMESSIDELPVVDPVAAIRRVLCVDDSSLARKMARKALEKAGYEVLEAINGQEGLKLLREKYKEAQANNKQLTDLINVVISDIEMPLMDGFTFTKSIKEDPELCSMPVILHSSLSRSVMANRGSDVGATEFLTKFNASTLVNAVSNIQ